MVGSSYLDTDWDQKSSLLDYVSFHLFIHVPCIWKALERFGSLLVRWVHCPAHVADLKPSRVSSLPSLALRACARVPIQYVPSSWARSDISDASALLPGSSPSPSPVLGESPSSHRSKHFLTCPDVLYSFLCWFTMSSACPDASNRGEVHGTGVYTQCSSVQPQVSCNNTNWSTQRG